MLLANCVVPHMIRGLGPGLRFAPSRPYLRRVMSDRTLQSLARSAASGDPESLVRYLREQIRAGKLETERLELAAHLGDPVCQSLLDQTAQPPKELQPRQPGR